MVGTFDLPTAEKLAEALSPAASISRVWALEGGISGQVTALELREPTGEFRRFVIRQHRHDFLPSSETTAAEREFRLLEGLHGQGLAVPRPIHLDLSGQILPGPYQVLSYVEGEMDLAPRNEEAYLLQLADHLAAIHRIDPLRLNTISLPRRAPTCPELSADRSSQASALDSTRFREALQTAGPPPQTNPLALLHGDYWPGNTLWRDGRLVTVIDWEDAEVGDPLVDLAKARSEIHWLFGPKALGTFTTRYLAQNPLDTSTLPRHDLCATLRQARLAGADLEAFAAYFPPRGRSDLTAEVLRERWETFGKAAQLSANPEE
jgi:aminoglycoside phosphotransferase (APT) family kinase protein